MHLTEHLTLEATPDRVFALIASPEGMKLFTGWGLVPGIARVVPDGPERGVGSRDIVHNTDGTSHPERVTVHEPPRAYALRIGPFAPPMARLVAGIDERWDLEGEGQRTRVRRRFTVHPSGWLARLVVRVFLAPQLRRAIRRNHAALRVALHAAG